MVQYQQNTFEQRSCMMEGILMQAITPPTKDSFDHILEQLKSTLQQQGNTGAANKAQDLIQKHRSEELVLAFCGHFSAGKSSLMNWLCGKQVLPTSPIPTTANIAAIRDGEPRAIVHLNNQEPSFEIGLDELDEYCKNGGEYESVDLWDDIKLLGAHGVLLDTPGVDSTDAAHEAATYSALHRADVVFYVMDYNHVQSETNLSFAKTLSERGKPLYLIVNQIDKHDDLELPFADYQRGVAQSFAGRGIEPAGILYVSRQEPQHRHGKLERLRTVIGELLTEREPLRMYSLSQAIWELAEEHTKWLQAQMNNEQEQSTTEDELHDDMTVEQLNAQLGQFEQQIVTAQNKIEDYRKSWSWEIGRLVDQANITPAPVRDLAQLYLESERPGFKKGFFASKEKTAQEREQRKSTFLTAYREQVAANLDVHVRGLLRGWSQEQQLWTEEQETLLTSSLPQITERDIEAGAGSDVAISGEYVLNYTRALREKTVAVYRRAALDAIERLFEQLQPKVEAEQQTLQQERDQLSERYQSLMHQQQLEQQKDQNDRAVRQLLPARAQLQAQWLPAIQEESTEALSADQINTTQASHNEASTAPSTNASGINKDASNSPDSAPAPAKRNAVSSHRKERLLQTAVQLRQASDMIEHIKGLSLPATELRRRAHVMENGKFTLALFGAFSAGKSSFANALLGEAVLPVSPHPMTAAITQIMAPEGEYDHGTAQVFMKSRTEMQEDISGAFRLLGLPEMTLEQDWGKQIASLSPARIHPSARAHYNFVIAAAAGWQEAEPLLGQELKIGLDQFRGFVSEETKSCFVRRIDLYYHCELTAQGMVLVDTPGADSVNARHTGVTFEYMKSADALVFVTYYNHAFTHGDRQLLEQLGRVKGSLALDNMFFVVNASDLASSEEEKNQVVERIVHELNTTGIRKPNIYALSSRRAIQGHDDGFRQFQQHFTSFADETLAGLAIQAAYDEVERVRKTVLTWEDAAKRGEAYRVERMQQLVQERAAAHAAAMRMFQTEPDRRIQEESSELLFHVRQRVRLKALDWMPEIFNPSLLNNESPDLKADFAACGRELLRRLSTELEQEVLATTLRMEKASERVVSERLEVYGREAEAAAAGLTLSKPELTKWQTPELAQMKIADVLDWKSLWSLFRNPRYFFEQGGREKFREEVSARLDQLIATMLEQQREQLSQYYIVGLNERLQEAADDMQRQIAEWVEGTEASLQTDVSADRWSALASDLDTLIHTVSVEDATRIQQAHDL